MIGLVRRPERRNRMISCLEELNINYTLFDAVDGRCVCVWGGGGGGVGSLTLTGSYVTLAVLSLYVFWGVLTNCHSNINITILSTLLLLQTAQSKLSG